MAAFYLALEPYIRRTWPELLVSWTRTLSGEFNDPLVGRDVFLGILFGAAQVSLWVSLVAAPFFLPIRGETPYFEPATLESTPAFLGDTLQKLNDSLTKYRGSLGDVSDGQAHKAEVDRRHHRRPLLDGAERKRLLLCVGNTRRLSVWSHRCLCDRASWAAGSILHVRFNFRTLEHAIFL
jgi:hypothetical protein